jgi:hypothetical protein
MEQNNYQFQNSHIVENIDINKCTWKLMQHLSNAFLLFESFRFNL